MRLAHTQPARPASPGTHHPREDTMDDRTSHGSSPLDGTASPQPTTATHQDAGQPAPAYPAPDQHALAPYPQSGHAGQQGHGQQYPGNGQQHLGGGQHHQNQGQQFQGGHMQVAPKSPAIAALASFFIAGLGQLINGDAVKAVMFFGAMVAMGVLSFVLSFILIGWLVWPFMFATWLWNIYDAYKSAQNWNSRHGIIS